MTYTCGMNLHCSHAKLSALGLSVALLATQSLFAYQPEKSFWSQRRQAARRTHAPVSASLPLAGAGEGSLAAQFPSPQHFRSPLSQTVARAVPKSFTMDHAQLLASLSPTHGTVRKVSLGLNPAPAGPVVIHIQDVHMNAEAQGNIRETLAGLLNSGQVGLIALEGSTNDIVLQPFVDFSNRKAVELTANYLLRENKISGPIHAAMTAQRQLPRILGIDDPVHYAANVQAYKDSAPKLEETRLRVIEQQKELDEQKKAVFSPTLLTLDQTVTDYRNDKVSLGNYVLALQEALHPSKNSSDYKVVSLFLNALKIERTLDFKQVEVERKRLIDRLTRSLNNQEIKSLMAQSVAYRTGELRYGDFYAQLKETCQKKGIHLADFPAMNEYIRYILLVDGIDADQLLNEISSLEKSAYGQLAKSSEEKALVARSRHLWLTARLVDFSLIPQEWQEYKAAGGKDTYLAPFESFYQEAETRDTAMAQNLLSALNDKHSKTGSVTAPIAVLVTGGFHADGMARQLTRQGVTVISYVPKIEKVDTTQSSAYLSVFTQEKTPLEKLFQGEKLFLSHDTVTATKTVATPIVLGMHSLLDEQSNLPIEEKEALLSFLKEETGKDVEVEVREVGRELDNGSVNVSIRLGEKETLITIRTGPNFEILKVDGFSPAPPSRIAHWLMRGAARLNMWLGPAARHVVKFTEAIPLSGLPFWTAANKAWWFAFHPKIKSVSDVVWQLAFLEATATASHQVRSKALSSFLNPIRAMWAQMKVHPRFNAISPIQATSTIPGNASKISVEGLEILNTEIDALESRLASQMGNIDKQAIEMIGALSEKLVQDGSVAQLERFGVLVAPRVFNFNNPMAEAAQTAILLVIKALQKTNSPEEGSARSNIVSQISRSPMNKWEEILWTLKLINNLPVVEVDPLVAGIIANAELRKIKSDTRMGKRMEYVAEDLQLQVGILLEHLQATSPLFSKIRLLVKLFPRESDLYSAWSLVGHIDDSLLDSKFSHVIRERIHGHFSNADYDLVVGYLHYLETGELENIRAVETFFIPDDNDKLAMSNFRNGTDRSIYDNFQELEKLLKRIIHHDPTGFERRYRILESHKEKTEELIRGFTQALSNDDTLQIVLLGGRLRNVFREELFSSNDAATRVQFLLLDEDVERLVYLQLGNYYNLVKENPAQNMQEIASIVGSLAEQLGAYGLVSLNTAELCAHIRDGRDTLYVSQLRDVARMLIDNHHQLGYVFLNEYHEIGMAITNKQALKVDQFIGALMRRRELDLHRAVQFSELLMTAADSYLKENEDTLFIPGGDQDKENGDVVPIFFHTGIDSYYESVVDRRAKYGSKGSNLAILGSHGIPIPEGFVLPAHLGRMRKELGQEAFNRWLDKKLTSWIKKLSANLKSNLRFGSPAHPLLLSVRSGSAISMPGMMSTIPNVGINDSIVEGLGKQTKNPWFAYDTYRLFLRDFAVSAWGMDPDLFDDVIPLLKVKENVPSKSLLSVKSMQVVVEQYKEIIARSGHKKELNAILSDPQLALILSINAVLDSWESGPARVYREREKLSHEWGTGVIVQRMRFGNLIAPDRKPSMTGVLFTRDGHSARFGLNGEYVLGSQGNDIVGGTAGHSSIHSIPDEMRINFPNLLRRLEKYALTADTVFRGNQDMEFTVEKRKLYVLQSRDKPYEGERARQLDPGEHRPITVGVGVSGGGYRGVVGFIDSDLDSLNHRVNTINGTIGKAKINGVILFVNAPGSAEVNKMLEVKGWAVGSGGRTSHAALMAKQHGVHAIFGLTFEINHENRWIIIKGIDGEKVIREGDVVSLDGSPHAGGLYKGSVPFRQEDWQGGGEIHGGIWPWMRALFVRVGISGKIYDRWFAWVVENGISQTLLGPLLAWSMGLMALWLGLPLDLLTGNQFAWTGFFLAHFFQMAWGKSALTRGSILSAGLLSIVGVLFGINPFSPVGLILHFVLNHLVSVLEDRAASLPRKSGPKPIGSLTEENPKPSVPGESLFRKAATQTFQWYMLASIKIALYSPEPLVRLGGAKSLAGLAAALGARSNGIELLEKLWKPLFERAMGNDNWQIQQAATNSLGALTAALGARSSGAELIEKLWKPLYLGALEIKNVMVQGEAVNSLGALSLVLGARPDGPKMLANISGPLYMNLLKDPDKDLRLGAAKNLGVLASAMATFSDEDRLKTFEKIWKPLFDRAVVDFDGSVKLAAAESLGELSVAFGKSHVGSDQWEKIFLPLFDNALTGRDWAPQRGAADSLGSLAIALGAQPDGATLLSKIWKPLYEKAIGNKGDWDVRRGAAASLGSLATALGAQSDGADFFEEFWRPLYVTAMGDPNWFVQRTAVESLGPLCAVFGARSVDGVNLLRTGWIPLFEEALENEGEQVKIGAAISLGPLATALGARSDGAELLTTMWGPLYSRAQEDRKLRRFAVTSLGPLATALGARSDGAALLAKMWMPLYRQAIGDPDMATRGAAVDSLGPLAMVLGSRSDGAELLTTMWGLLYNGAQADTNLRRLAVRSLGPLATALGARSDGAALLAKTWIPLYGQAIGDPDMATRAAAVDSLGSLATALGARSDGAVQLEKLWMPLYERAKADPAVDVQGAAAGSLGALAMVGCSVVDFLAGDVENLWLSLRSAPLPRGEEKAFYSVVAQLITILLYTPGQDSQRTWKQVIEILGQLHEKPAVSLSDDVELSPLLVRALVEMGGSINRDDIIEAYKSYFSSVELPRRNTGPKDLLAHILFDSALSRHGIPRDFAKFLREGKLSPSFAELLPLLRRVSDGEEAFVESLRGFSDWAPTGSETRSYWAGVQSLLGTAARDWEGFRILEAEDRVREMLRAYITSPENVQSAGGKVQLINNTSRNLAILISQEAGRVFNLNLERVTWNDPTEKELNVLFYVARHSNLTNEEHPLNVALRPYFLRRLSGGTVGQALADYRANLRTVDGFSDLLEPLESFLDEKKVGLKGPIPMSGQVFLIGASVRDRELAGNWTDGVRHLSELVANLPKVDLSAQLGSLLDEIEKIKNPEDSHLTAFLPKLTHWMETAKESIPHSQTHLFNAILNHLSEVQRLLAQSADVPSAKNRMSRVRGVVIALETDPIEQLHLGWPQIGGSCLDLVRGAYQTHAAGYPLNPALGIIFIRDPRDPSKAPLARVSVGLDPARRILFPVSPIKTSTPYNFSPLVGRYLQEWARDQNLQVFASKTLGYDYSLGRDFVPRLADDHIGIGIGPHLHRPDRRTDHWMVF
jgi:hypothetical protein